MKLKNTSNKAISVGGACILPSEVGEVADSFASNASIKMMERIGNLKVVGKAPAQEDTQPGQSQQQGQTQEQGEEKKPLSRLNKDELLEECRKLGIETTEDDTRDTLVKKIKEKTTE